ncbi:unnamed protein product, partial [Rotaria magnacalcarata]
IYYQPSLGIYIQQKINDQTISYANDTQLRYQYEGDGSIVSNLSSIESTSVPDDNNYSFLNSFKPKL